MPNRIARDSARTSKTLAQLSDFGERGFWRLMLTADDFGRFEADPPVVLAQCFPRMTANVTLRRVEAMLAECVAVGLIILYEVEGVGYGQFVKADKYFTRRSKHSKYPPCVASATQTHSTCVASASEVRGSRGEDRGARNTALSGLRPTALRVLDFLNHKTHRNYQPVDSNLKLITARLNAGATEDQCRAVIGLRCAKWLGDAKMAEYLRPATIFNATNFAQYQGELPPTAFEPESNGHAG